MAWIILEGVDRVGKSTVAELYKRQGYEIVHMSAPDKKYTQPGYTGPSYLDEILDVYMKYSHRDVVFDRSPYGETVWPFVYGRKSQLSDDDIEFLQDMENQNDIERYLLHDPDVEAHWKRCVDNKEPLNRSQFAQANGLFDKMGRKYSFHKKVLSDFSALQKSVTVDLSTPKEAKQVNDSSNSTLVSNAVNIPSSASTSNKVTPELQKLEKANAINDILAKRIIRQKGEMYDALEKEVRDFLVKKLSTIFGEDKSNSFSDDEVQILKIYVKQLKQKLETKR